MFADDRTLSELDAAMPFEQRHVGLTADDAEVMLKLVGHPTLEALMEAAVPGGIRSEALLELPAPVSERAASVELRRIAGLNRPAEAMIGLGYHGTVTPPVVRRNVLEDPSWYTAYTPYQPEISQGRLEALINFQTMVGDLTGLDTSNSSLLDEGTAAAEAMTLVRRANRKSAGPFVVDADALPQTVEVVRTRARGMGIEVVVADLFAGVPGRMRGRTRLVVGNVPCLVAEEFEGAADTDALGYVGTDDGLGLHRALLDESTAWLSPDGVLVLQLPPDRVQDLLPEAAARGWAVAQRVDGPVAAFLALRRPGQPVGTQ